MPSDQQRNASDCGVFSMLNLEARSRGASVLSRHRRSSEYIRFRVAWELFSGELLALTQAKEQGPTMEPHPVTADSSLIGTTMLLGEAAAEVAVVASSSPSVVVVEALSRTHSRKRQGEGSPQADRHFTKKIKIIVSDDENSDIHQD